MIHGISPEAAAGGDSLTLTTEDDVDRILLLKLPDMVDRILCRLLPVRSQVSSLKRSGTLL